MVCGIAAGGTCKRSVVGGFFSSAAAEKQMTLPEPSTNTGTVWNCLELEAKPVVYLENPSKSR